MDAGKIFGKGISFPPRIVGGRVAWSVGEDNVRESIKIILLTEQNERLRLAEFGGGLSRFLFEPNTVATRHQIGDRITKELARWEPRVSVESVIVEPDADDPQAATATITYQLIATQTRERVSLNITLNG